MGIFNVALEIGDPEGERYETVEAMVDSARLIPSCPRLCWIGWESSHIPAGLSYSQTEPGSAGVSVVPGSDWKGEEDISPVVFWDEGTTPLLGAVTLEIFSLGIDPVNNQLIPIESRMSPTLHRGED